MKVSQLIDILQTMPKDAEVWCVWDGAPRTGVEAVWMARSGQVMLADPGDVVYGTEDRPASAPTEEEEPYWSVPELPSEDCSEPKS